MKEMQSLMQRDLFTTMFIESLFTIAKTWKQSKSPFAGEWIKKLRNTCIHTDTQRNIYQPLKKEILPSVTTWSLKTDKDKYYMISPICGIRKKKKPHKLLETE